MSRLARFPLFFPLLALALLAEGFSYVGMRLLTPYDNARLEPGQNAWLAEGVEVSPLAEEGGGLRSGDVVIAVEGRPMRAWAQALFQPGVARPALQAGEPVTYSLIRDGQRLEMQIQPGAFPLRALRSLHWGVYAFLLGLQGIMTYVLLRRPEEEAARALFVFAWSTWHAFSWTTGLHASDIVSGSGYWLYRAATFPNFLLTFSAILHTNLVFPKRIPILDRYPRLLYVVYLAPYGLFILYMATMRLFSADLWDWLGHWNAGEWAVAAIYVACAVMAAIGNYRAGHDIATRLKIRWAIFGLVATAASVFFLWLLPGALVGKTLVPTSVIPLLALPLPLGLAIAILRHRLFDIDIVINRALVYGALTTVIVATYAIIVGYVGALFHAQASDHARNDLIFSLIAAGLVAAIFQPLRMGLQRVANRFMYGERDDPYTVLARLGEKLEAVGSVETTLPTIVETIAQALKLPYVAIVFKDENGSRVAAAYGTPQPREATKYPLVYQNESFGDLVLAQRSENESFTLNEQRLLADLAREVEFAAHNVRLTADLQRSRQELVTSREEERRRIRRDLHDEIGPLLASQSLTLEAIEKLIAQDPAAATSLVRDLKGQTQGAVQEIRRIIYDLRPPALDDLGLVEALRERFAHLEQSRLGVELDAPEDIPSLGAAVETAVYRIAVEAVTNVIRHAGAGECRVHLRVDGDLQLEIRDDGAGLPAKFRAGVGLRAMQERAEELGGTFRIERLAGKGTRLFIRLPIPAEAK